MQSSPKILNALLRLGGTPPCSPQVHRRTDVYNNDAATRISRSVGNTPSSSPYMVRKFCSTTLAAHHGDIADIVVPTTQADNATVTSSQWTWQGPKRDFISKNPEQYWKDLQDNRKEMAWSQTERVHSTIFPTERDSKSTQWFSEWKENSSKSNKQRPVMQLNMDQVVERSDRVYSPSQVQIMITKPPKESSGSSTSLHVDSSDHRAYFDSIGRELGIRSPDDWYTINILDLKRFASSYEVLACYGNSLIQALMSVYPEHSWKIWHFENTPKGLLDAEEPEQRPIKKTDEPQVDSRSEDPNTTLRRYKDHWQVKLFGTSKSDSWAQQAAPYMRQNENVKINSDNFEETFDIPRKAYQLTNLVHELFPEMKPHIEYTSPELVYSDTKRPFTLDVYLPEVKLAFEYIEDPNYTWQYSFGANFSIYTFHKAKRAVCEKLGITLIEVPSWWNREVSSLASAIKRCRPELLQEPPSPRGSPKKSPKKSLRAEAAPSKSA